MRPKIKQKRIDPRYFLNETINRGELEEIEPNPSPIKVEIAPLPSPKRDDDEEEDEKDLDPGTPGKQKLLKGEKSLYEKLRGAIEEVIDEYLEERASPDTYATPSRGAKGVTGRSPHKSVDVHHGTGKKGRTVHPAQLPGTGGAQVTTDDSGHTKKGGVTPSRATVIAQSTYGDEDTVDDINRKNLQGLNKAVRTKVSAKVTNKKKEKK